MRLNMNERHRAIGKTITDRKPYDLGQPRARFRDDGKDAPQTVQPLRIDRRVQRAIVLY